MYDCNKGFSFPFEETKNRSLTSGSTATFATNPFRTKIGLVQLELAEFTFVFLNTFFKIQAVKLGDIEIDCVATDADEIGGVHLLKDNVYDAVTQRPKDYRSRK